MLNYAQLFASVSHEWAVFLISLIPMAELKVAVPVGLEVYKLPILQTVLIALIGNMLPVTGLLALIPKLHDWIIKQKLLGSVLTRFLKRAEKKFSKDYDKSGPVALVSFVALPFPLTGAWIGSLAAFVFNIPFKRAFIYILIGMCVEAVIITSITLFAGNTLRWLL